MNSLPAALCVIVMLAAAPALLEAQAAIVETFTLLEDWTDRYQYLIDLGRNQKQEKFAGIFSAQPQTNKSTYETKRRWKI